MALSLDIGTITIRDENAIHFIQGKTLTEIKSIIVDMLTTPHIQSVPHRHSTARGKWAAVADQMRGTLSHETVEYLNECSHEVREGFALRDLKR